MSLLFHHFFVSDSRFFAIGQFNWKPKQFVKTNNFLNKEKKNDHIDKFENILEDVVKDTLISDVPIGFFLSSGIDSSLIASIATRVTKKK